MRGTKSLLTRLNAISKAVREDAPKEIEKEVRNRASVASSNFASAQYDGTNDVIVTTDSAQNAWSITASGESVLFIEYGTGLRLKHDSGFGDFAAYTPGSWSAMHSRFLYEPKWVKWRDWWPLPGGGMTLGNPSANVMYDTNKNLRQTVPLVTMRAIGKALR